MASKRDRAAYEGSPNTPPPHAKYVVFGTALPPFDSNIRDDGSYVPEWKQEVTDERGRKRFHGAFTGGFSAGYFNTVGSKEGFVPKTFVSSRSKRFKDTQQRPEDYMDDEDLTEHAESQSLNTHDSFAGIGARNQDDDTNEALFSDVFRTKGETKGHQLLRRMKWRDGQGIGPLVKRRAEGDKNGELHAFAPKDVPLIAFFRKTDRKGVGYGAEITLRPLPSTKPKPRKKKLGVISSTLSDDDENRYEFGPRIKIGRNLGGDKRKKKAAPDSEKQQSAAGNSLRTRKCYDGRDPLKGFVLSIRSRPQPDTTKYAPPEVPKDWKPSKVHYSARESSSVFQSTSDAAKASNLDPKARATLLGEQILPGKSIFDFMSPANRDRIVAATGNKALPAALNESLPGNAVPNEAERRRTLWDMVPNLDKATAAGALLRGATGWMPYSDDEAKRARYKCFLEVSAGQRSELPERAKGASIEDWARELREFAEAAEIFKPTTGLLASRFTSSSNAPNLASDAPDGQPSQSAAREEDPAEKAAIMGMHGMLTRTRERFFPNRLLCKRFGVRAPPDADPDMGRPTESGGSAGHDDGVADVTRRLDLVGQASMEKIMLSANLHRASSGSGSVRDVRQEGSKTHSSPENQELAPGQAQIGQPAKVDPEINEALEGDRPNQALFRSIFGDDDDEED